MRHSLKYVALLILLSCNSKSPDSSRIEIEPSRNLDGEVIFKSNCANCHKIDADFTGPSLVSCFNKRSNEWVYLFLTKRDTLKTDSLTKNLIAEYTFSCPQFPNLTQKDIGVINDYLHLKDE